MLYWWLKVAVPKIRGGRMSEIGGRFVLLVVVVEGGSGGVEVMMEICGCEGGC